MIDFRKEAALRFLSNNTRWYIKDKETGSYFIDETVLVPALNELFRTAYERGVEDAAKVADEADASMPIVKLQRKYAPSRSSHDQNEMRRLRQVHLQSQIMG